MIFARNRIGEKTGTKEFLVYSRKNRSQENGTETSQHCQESTP